MLILFTSVLYFSYATLKFPVIWEGPVQREKFSLITIEEGLKVHMGPNLLIWELNVKQIAALFDLKVS